MSLVKKYIEFKNMHKSVLAEKNTQKKQDIISNIVDLIENYGPDVFKVITLLDYDVNHLLDYEYLETQMINHIQNTN